VGMSGEPTATSPTCIPPAAGAVTTVIVGVVREPLL
jgi:hypothetical protein